MQGIWREGNGLRQIYIDTYNATNKSYQVCMPLILKGILRN